MTFPRSNQWIPIRLGWQDGRPLVDWCYLGRHRFTRPFFADTVERCLRLPFNILFSRQTPIDDLVAWHDRQPGMRPTGFIFHMSRCGSTLAAQMLAASRCNVVLSEPALIDQVLRTPEALASASQKIAWLQAAVSALGQCRWAQERRLFIKFDSWHTQYLPIVCAAFPATPWIFLYRDPEEVLLSQLGQPGEFLVPTAEACEYFGVGPVADMRLRPVEYYARVLATILRGVLDFGADGRLLVHYRELPEAMERSIAAHFQMDCAPAELELMRAASSFDAKNPQLYFAPRSDHASEEIRAASRRWLQPLYNQLDAMRLCQPGVTGT